ncbi:MAG: hypothetical protein AUK47_21360 [Deltaproteobacteria bacterium CG2_30_63_29]|nr:MAG: hypothetical protein AUK47_21360 [Deltaproteobacteria bacterium CG2_30_63_29]
MSGPSKPAAGDTDSSGVSGARSNVAALALLLLVLAWLPGQGAASALRWWVLCGALPLVSLVTLGLGPRPWPRVASAWLALAGLSAASAVVVASPGGAAWQAVVVCGWTNALWIGWATVHTAHAERTLGRAAAAAGALAAVGVWMPWWGPAGSFGNVDLLAGFLALCLVWTGVVASGEADLGPLPPTPSPETGEGEPKIGGQRGVTVGLWVSVLVQAVALVQLESWGAFCAVLVGLGSAAVWGSVRRWGRGVGALAGLVGIAVLGVFLRLPAVLEHIEGRLLMVRVSLKMVFERPLLGLGAGSFPSGWMNAQAAYFGSNLTHPDSGLWTHAHHAHNEFLHVGAELGGLGLLLFVAPIVLALARRPVRLGAWSASVAFVVMALVSMPLYEPATAFLACLGLGAALGAGRATESPEARAEIGVWRRRLAVAGVAALLVLTSADLIADRLLVRGVEADSANTLALAQRLALRPERAMRYRAALLPPQESLELARRAAERDPSPDAWALVGQLAATQGELQKAREAYLESVRLCPFYYTGVVDLAQISDRLGDYQGALRWGEQAKRLRPSDPRNVGLVF